MARQVPFPRPPQEGNEAEEHLADQIDQRLWSYMYGPGMQMFREKVDDRVDSGMTMMGAIEKAHAEKIAKMETAQCEKMQELKLQQEKGRGELEGKMKALKVGLWVLGGVTLVGMCGLGVLALWPRIKSLLQRNGEQEEAKGERTSKNSTIVKRDGARDDYFNGDRRRM